MVVRNEHGAEGWVRWSKLQARAFRVRLAYGSALTIDAAQGITSTEYIGALLSGTGGVTGSKTYVVESRHERTTGWCSTRRRSGAGACAPAARHVHPYQQGR
jgi:hypothetical protein